MAIRENERKALLDNEEFITVHDVINSAKKYREGYALRFNIKNEADFKIPGLLIKRLTIFRS